MFKSCTIFERFTDEVLAKLKKLEKKAVSYGSFFCYTLGEPYVKEIPVTRYDEVLHITYEVERIPCLVRDVAITGDDIKKNGWTVNAQLEHLKSGNIINAFGPEKVDPKWLTAPCHCDHCNTSRYRKMTYVVTDPNGNEKQVGSTCLQDYTGINPALAVFWASAWFDAFEAKAFDDYDHISASVVYDVETVIGLATDIIKTHGYVKSGNLGCTKERVLDAMASHKMPSDEASDKARAIMTWLKGNGNSFGYDSIEKKCSLLADQEWCKPNHVGLLAYIPVAYDRYMDKLQKAKTRKEEAKLSDYLGEVGKKITVKIDRAMVLTSWETMYGTTIIYRFKSGDNTLIWKTSKELDVDTILGHSLTGTVKDHGEYRGERQTELTRCKIA